MFRAIKKKILYPNLGATNSNIAFLFKKDLNGFKSVRQFFISLNPRGWRSLCQKGFAFKNFCF